MAITLTPAGLAAALRLGDSPEETAEATRLLAYVTAAISTHLADAYEDAPDAVVNEAGIRLAGYLFDMPNAGRGLSYANAGRNSGAWQILLPYRIHRAGSTDDAVAAAQEAVGSTSNPVTDVAISGGNLVVTFNDGTTRDEPLPAGMTGDGTDQTARDAAAAAQGTADGATTAAAAAQSDIDAHEANHHPSGGAGVDQTARDAASAAQAEINAHELTLHNTDTVARSTAVNARQIGEAAQATADAVRTELTTHETTPHGGGGGTDQMARAAAAAAQAEIDAHEASTHNHDATARDAAAAAQAGLEAHEASPHNTDAGARTAAAAAQGTADGAQTAAAAAQSEIDAHELTLHNTDGPARTAAAAAQARADDAYTLADGKVDSSGAVAAARDVINAHEDIVNVLDGRLPGLPIVMRLGWSQREDFIAADFARPSPPLGGSVAGLSDGLAAPPFPPGLAGDPTLFLGIWLAGDPDVVEISGGGAQFGDARPLTLDAGKAGVYVVSTARLRPLEGTIFSVTITGPRIVTESDLAAHVGDPDAHHTPPTGMGGGPVVLYEVATAAIGTSTGLIAGNVACPETGALEFYFEGLTGTRQGAVAYARIPVARIRGAVSALNIAYSNNSATLLAIPHGANRGVGVAVQATTNYLMLSAQAPGDFFIRVLHTG